MSLLRSTTRRTRSRRAPELNGRGCYRGKKFDARARDHLNHVSGAFAGGPILPSSMMYSPG